MVLRNGLEVEVFAIDHGASAFIHNLQNGQPLIAGIGDRTRVRPQPDPGPADQPQRHHPLTPQQGIAMNTRLNH